MAKKFNILLFVILVLTLTVVTTYAGISPAVSTGNVSSVPTIVSTIVPMLVPFDTPVIVGTDIVSGPIPIITETPVSVPTTDPNTPRIDVSLLPLCGPEFDEITPDSYSTIPADPFGMPVCRLRTIVPSGDQWDIRKASQIHPGTIITPTEFITQSTH